MHVGGVYGNKEKSLRRFIKRYRKLDENIRNRLVIENDDKNYNLKNCLKINVLTGIPILFDLFHHEINSSGETIIDVFKGFIKTWKNKDGIPMVDYSSQQSGEIEGKHIKTINLKHFTKFLHETKPFDFDVVLEIKDKEKSALKAIKKTLIDSRFINIGTTIVN